MMESFLREEERIRLTKIVEIIESFERNPNETRIKLRMQLGFVGILYIFIFVFFSNNLINGTIIFRLSSCIYLCNYGSPF